jgi:hypothetical protein
MLRLRPLAAVMALLCLSGCAYLNPKPAPDQAGADRIAVYEALPPDNREYRLVKRLWVDPWTSAIAVPRYASIEAGAADLRNHAVVLGGDAIMNFGCYHSDVDPRSFYYCNGNVIKYAR